MSKSSFIKNNKIIISIVLVLLILIVFVSIISKKPKSISTQNTTTAVKSVQYTDAATGDNAAESLDALTQQLHAVIESNKQLQSSNAALNKKNASILENIRQEVEQNLDTELKRRGQDNREKIAKLQQTLMQINTELTALKKKQASRYEQNKYPVDGQGSQNISGPVHVLAGNTLVEIPDISNHPESSKSKPISENSSILHPHGMVHSFRKRKSKGIPYYTIPSGATLADSVTMTSLIGRVPVDGVVKSPYPFKIIIGGKNLAANGLHIPGLSGAIVQGVTVGDMALSCVKGYVTAITFVFPDGTISTTQLQASGNGGDLGFTNSLGYLSQPNGNPCFPGKFYTNAPKYLSTMIALGALNQGGQAYSQAQTTAITNAMGGTTSSLTGSVGKYMLGGAVAGGTSEAMHWFTEREKNSFDAVYVRAGRQAVINITKQIAINYNPTGRKLYYEHNKVKHNNTSLD